MVQTLFKECMERLQTSNVSVSNGSTEEFDGKFTAKNGVLIGHFMLSLLMLTLEVLSLSIHYLISIWTTCW